MLKTRIEQSKLAGLMNRRGKNTEVWLKISVKTDTKLIK